VQINSDQLLFVYGTLRKKTATTIYKYLKENSKYIGSCYTNGNLYEVEGYPAFKKSNNINDKVYGELYHINKNSETILHKLDEYEECSDNFAKPHEYIREKIKLYGKAAEIYYGWAYIYNFPVKNLCLIKSGDYIKFIKENNIKLFEPS
jgi:gamma-glutamylcyclotransferase (GGCT)/AIG2-like uncharacterized protein YtfP